MDYHQLIHGPGEHPAMGVGGGSADDYTTVGTSGIGEGSAFGTGAQSPEDQGQGVSIELRKIPKQHEHQSVSVSR